MIGFLSNNAAKKRQTKLDADLAAFFESGGKVSQPTHEENAHYKPSKVSKRTERVQKLTHAKVRKIRAALAPINDDGSRVKEMQKLAHKYGVGYSLIRKVYYRLAWKEVI